MEAEDDSGATGGNAPFALPQPSSTNSRNANFTPQDSRPPSPTGSSEESASEPCPDPTGNEDDCPPPQMESLTAGPISSELIKNAYKRPPSPSTNIQPRPPEQPELELPPSGSQNVDGVLPSQENVASPPSPSSFVTTPAQSEQPSDQRNSPVSIPSRSRSPSASEVNPASLSVQSPQAPFVGANDTRLSKEKIVHINAWRLISLAASRYPDAPSNPATVRAIKAYCLEIYSEQELDPTKQLLNPGQLLEILETHGAEIFEPVPETKKEKAKRIEADEKRSQGYSDYKNIRSSPSDDQKA